MKTNKIRISTDYDSTLTKPSVQKFVTQLIKQGHEVWICTSRFADEFATYSNSDLYEIAEQVGIPKQRIQFMNMADKAEFLNGKDFKFHLDDDSYELKVINEETDVIGINVFGNKTWKRKCQEILRIHKKIKIRNEIHSRK